MFQRVISGCLIFIYKFTLAVHLYVLVELAYICVFISICFRPLQFTALDFALNPIPFNDILSLDDFPFSMIQAIFEPTNILELWAVILSVFTSDFTIINLSVVITCVRISHEEFSFYLSIDKLANNYTTVLDIIFSPSIWSPKLTFLIKSILEKYRQCKSHYCVRFVLGILIMSVTCGRVLYKIRVTFDSNEVTNRL